MDNRKLSEDEIEAIAKKVTAQIEQDLYIGVGSGILSLAWKGMLLIVIALAVYGLNSKIFHIF